MARKRFISTDISVDTRVAKLASTAGDFAALLYTWMVPHTGDDGSITGDYSSLKLIVIPGLEHRGIDDIEAAVEAMISLGLIYREGTRLVFPPEAFYRYQSYVPEGKRRQSIKISEEQRESAPNSEEQRRTAKNSEEQRESAKNSAYPFLSYPLPSYPSPSQRSLTGSLSAQAPQKKRIRALSEAEIAGFRDENPALDVDRQAQRYLTNEAAKAPGKRHHDQIAGFRNWLDNLRDRGPPTTRNGTRVTASGADEIERRLYGNG